MGTHWIRITLWRCLVVIFAFTCAQPAAAGPLVLAEEGVAKAAIIMPNHATDLERYAAEYLARYLSQMTGGTFTAIAESARQVGGEATISVGRTRLADGYVMGGDAPKRDNPEAFRMLRQDDTLIICGNPDSDVCDNGTLWGVYAFLRMHGLGFYLPDDLGDVIPSKPTIVVDKLDFTDAPAFETRGGSTPAGYLKRYKPGGDLVEHLPDGRGGSLKRGISGGSRIVEFYHMYQYVITPEVRQAHPEWFENTHNPKYGPQPTPGIHIGYGHEEVGLCFSRPEIRQLFIDYLANRLRSNPDLYAASICPDDYYLGDRCDCSECQRLMNMSVPPTFTQHNSSEGNYYERSSSDLQIDFVNAVAKGLEDEFPDRKLITYAYLDFIDPPTRTRVHPNVVIMIAPLRTPDELHPALDEVVRGWQAMGAQKLYWYGYILARPPIPHLMGEWFRNYQRLGIEGVYLEFSPGVGAFSAMNQYLYDRLMWNPQADVSALIEEFCAQLFGPVAGDHMRRFFLAWELNPPEAHHDIPQLLAAAEQAASDPVAAKRVRLFKLAYELWRSSPDVHEALKLNDLPAARAAAQAGIAAAAALKAEYPDWAMSSSVALHNYASTALYPTTVLPAVERLLNNPLLSRTPEQPAPGPLVCLTNNADLPFAAKRNVDLAVSFSPPVAGQAPQQLLFDGRTDRAVSPGGASSFLIDLDFRRAHQIESVEVCTGMNIEFGGLLRLVTVPIYIEISLSNDGQNFTTVDRILPRTLRGYVRSGLISQSARFVRVDVRSLNMGYDVNEVRVWGRPKR